MSDKARTNFAEMQAQNHDEHDLSTEMQAGKESPFQGGFPGVRAGRVASRMFLSLTRLGADTEFFSIVHSPSKGTRPNLETSPPHFRIWASLISSVPLKTGLWPKACHLSSG